MSRHAAVVEADIDDPELTGGRAALASLIGVLLLVGGIGLVVGTGRLGTLPSEWTLGLAAALLIAAVATLFWAWTQPRADDYLPLPEPPLVQPRALPAAPVAPAAATTSSGPWVRDQLALAIAADVLRHDDTDDTMPVMAVPGQPRHAAPGLVTDETAIAAMRAAERLPMPGALRNHLSSLALATSQESGSRDPGAGWLGESARRLIVALAALDPTIQPVDEPVYQAVIDRMWPIIDQDVAADLVEAARQEAMA